MPKIERDALPGSVVAVKVRCGKSGCRCGRGELYGPYHYRVWREDGRQRKAYVRAGEVESVRAACAAWGREKRSGRDLRRLARRKVERVKRRVLRECGIVPYPAFMRR